jgi:hypothetical protein
MLNFTVRDGFPLEERIGFLQDSFREIYNSDRKRRKYWIERFPGGIKSLEVKTGSGSGAWHPHYHCLVMQEGNKEFVKDYEWVSSAWHEITGFKTNNVRLLKTGEVVEVAETVLRKDGTPDLNYNGNVFIKKVSARGKKGILSAVCESLKYIVKVDETIFGKDGAGIKNMTLFEEAYYTLKGKRQTSTWGILYGITEEKISEDMKNENEEDLIEFICQRCGCTRGTLIDLIYREIGANILLDIKKSKKNISVGAEDI